MPVSIHIVNKYLLSSLNRYRILSIVIDSYSDQDKLIFLSYIKQNNLIETFCTRYHKYIIKLSYMYDIDIHINNDMVIDVIRHYANLRIFTKSLRYNWMISCIIY